ncbi:MAG: serine/threonine-protein phosphatase [Deltaproteobacteria bacterium]|nr:serine/threonine-protein phosphatase [Deltaproteobacteria bacterium]
MPGEAWLVFGIAIVGLTYLAYHYSSKRHRLVEAPAATEKSERRALRRMPSSPDDTRARSSSSSDADVSISKQRDDDDVAGEREGDDDAELTPTPVPPALIEAGKEKEPEPEPAIPKILSEGDDDEVTRIGGGEPGAPRQIPKAEVIFFDDDGIDDPEIGVDESAPALLPQAVGITDRGRRRKTNEDSMLVDAARRVFAVADGMGGHRGGEIASKLAVDTMAKAFSESDFQGSVEEELHELATELAKAIQMANMAIRDETKRQRALDGMGTTMCSVRFSGDGKRMYIGHVGDSRCYRMREGKLTCLTTDHTMAEVGVTGPEADNLSRALGVWHAVPIDIIGVAPQANDVFLLCSDGLTKMLHDDRIRHVLGSEDDDVAAVKRLVTFANAYGGKDNITVILIRMLPA